MLPFPVGNWAKLIGNPFIRNQRYNVNEQTTPTSIKVNVLHLMKLLKQ